MDVRGFSSVAASWRTILVPMFNSDATTFDSLRKLWGAAAAPNRKPFLLWVGAGASSWLGSVGNTSLRDFTDPSLGAPQAIGVLTAEMR